MKESSPTYQRRTAIAMRHMLALLLSFCVPVEALAAVPHAIQSPALITFTNNAPVVLPVRFVDGAIILRVTIAGRGLDFGVDTGSSAMTIDPDVARELGLASKDGQVTVPQMQIGDVQLTNVALREVALQAPVGSNTKVVGLLGHDFLASGVFAIDFKKQSLIVYPPGIAPLGDATLHKVPIGPGHGVLVVPLSFDGIEGRFILDTGAQDTEIYRHFLDTLPNHTMLGGYKTLQSVRVEFKGYAAEVRDLEFGGITYETVAALVPEAPGEIPGFDGLIGRDILQDYILYLDYANDALYLRPNA